MFYTPSPLCGWSIQLDKKWLWVSNMHTHWHTRNFLKHNKTIVTSCQHYINKLRMNMEISVRRLNFMSNRFTCYSNFINQLFKIKDNLLHVAKQFNFFPLVYCGCCRPRRVGNHWAKRPFGKIPYRPTGRKSANGGSASHRVRHW